MIPKVIHYCWFGGNELPELAMKCIDSWKKFCPDYEIKQWNEKNYDLDSSRYIKEAYKNKKWAFVSDYARLDIIYNNGGIYLDTDVELIKPLDLLCKDKCYFGEETIGYVNTGLGFGAEKNNYVIRKLLDEYNGCHFKKENGMYDMEPCPVKNTRPLAGFGYEFSGKNIWRCEKFVVYPPEYFCPLDYNTKLMNVTVNTISIHLYNASWHTWLDRVILVIEGKKKNGIVFKIRRAVSLPFRVINKIIKNGLSNTVRFVIGKKS